MSFEKKRKKEIVFSKCLVGIKQKKKKFRQMFDFYEEIKKVKKGKRFYKTSSMSCLYVQH